MRVDPSDLDSPRGRVALGRLVQGDDVLSVGPITVSKRDGRGLALTIWSQWQAENVSRDIAEDELRNGLSFYKALKHDWPQLASLLGEAQPPWSLEADYGGGAVLLCKSGPGGEIEWLHPKLKDPE